MSKKKKFFCQRCGEVIFNGRSNSKYHKECAKELRRKFYMQKYRRLKMKKFDETSYKLFRQQLGEEIFKIPQLDTPTCIALSGGLDSSCILALYKKTCRNLRTYSIGFKNSNEFDKASLVAKYFKVEHKNILITKKQYEKACREIIKKKKKPLQVPNEALLYLIAKQFSKDIHGKKGWFFSGEGIDELYGGYTNILDTVPYKKGDLIRNYMRRIAYDDIELCATKKEQKKYYDIFRNILKGFKGNNYDKVQHLLLSTHFPALHQRLRSVELVKGICLYLPFIKERAWLQLYQVLPKEFRVNKTFLRIIFARVLPKEVLDAEKIGFSLPLILGLWQEWNLDIWKKGKSNIDFWL